MNRQNAVALACATPDFGDEWGVKRTAAGAKLGVAGWVVWSGEGWKSGFG